MALTKETKEKIIKDNQFNDKDTGSAEVQIALLTEEINRLTEHKKNNPHDHNAGYGLIKKVSRRKALLQYLIDEDVNRYRALIKKLGLRK